MISRFACIATSRRRRALAGTLVSPSARARRVTGSLRRATGLWRELMEAGMYAAPAERPTPAGADVAPARASRR